MQRDVLIHYPIKDRQQQFGQGQRQYQRNEYLHQTFRKKLNDQRLPLGPRHLTHSDLFIS